MYGVPTVYSAGAPVVCSSPRAGTSVSSEAMHIRFFGPATVAIGVAGPGS